MRFSTSAILAAVAAPLLAFAQTNSTNGNGPNAFKIPTSGITASAGKTTTLNWTPTTDGSVTLILRSGASNNLNEGAIIASNIPNSGSYDWSVPGDITRGSDYAVEIVSDDDEQDVNYTGPFVIDSPNTVATSTGEVTKGVLTASPISTTGGSNSASATDSSSMTGSSSASAASGSSSMTGMSSGSMTGSSSMATMTSGSSGSSTQSGASATQSDLQASSSSEAAGAKVTAMAGMLGVVALGALAL